MKTVYIETSIPSFYHEIRQEPEMVARRHWTRYWWEQCALRYDLVTSEGVVAELQEGEYETQAAAVDLVADLPQLEVVDIAVTLPTQTSLSISVSSTRALGCLSLRS